METTTRRLRVKRGAEQWRVLLSRFDGSGLSVAEFCAREGISDTSFHRWRGRRGRPAAANPTGRRRRSSSTPAFCSARPCPLHVLN
ncbi:MAG: hypothetical protein JNN21_02040 [Candidatus Accumulibacter sp.]|nr:hypothetical protein [Accumulibacter sp.]